MIILQVGFIRMSYAYTHFVIWYHSLS